MTVSLLELDDGRFSLEFDDSDFPVILKTLQNSHGKPRQKSRLSYQEIWVGEFRFIFQNEWDDPCLISTSLEGDSILKTVADQLVIR